MNPTIRLDDSTSNARRRMFGLGLAALLLTTLAAARPAHAQLSLLGGGGWSTPRGDSAAYVLNGLTGRLALELELGPNLGLVFGGEYTGFGRKSSKLKADLGLPPTDPLDGETRIVDVTLAPKLYLLNRDIAAYFTGGGGPRWLTHRLTAPGTGARSERGEQAWGVLGGFGVDAVFSEGFRVGFTPTYHRVNARRGAIEYVTFVFYLKL